MKISAEDFIRKWQSCSSLEEASQILNMNKNTISARASLYRRKGIALRKFVGGKKTTNWLALAKLAEECANGSGKKETTQKKTKRGEK